MPAVSILAPYSTIPDIDGTALDLGYVFIGQAGLNAETNRITVYWDEDLQIEAFQPIRTINGYLARDGQVAEVFVNANDYSIIVKNKNKETIFDKRNYSLKFPFVSFEYTPVGESNVVSREISSKLSEIISVKDFGAVGDGVTSDTTAFTNAEASATAHIYLPPGTYVVEGISLNKMYWGPGIIELDDDLIPNYLSAYRSTKVVVFPPADNISNVLLPDGSWLDVAGSFTGGLQEAIDYALGDSTAGSGNFDLEVVGGDGVVFTCTQRLIFPTMVNRKVTFGACSITLDISLGPNPGLQFNSMYNTTIDMESVEVIYAGTGHVVDFNNFTSLISGPADFSIRSCKVRMGVLTNNNDAVSGPSSSIVRFRPERDGITENEFTFALLNQDNASSSASGVFVSDIVANGWHNNTIRANIKGITNAGVHAGETGGGVATNTWHLDVEGEGFAGSRAYDTWMSNELLFITCHSSLHTGIAFHTPAASNTIVSPRFSPSTTKISYGGANPTSNRLIRSGPVAIATTGTTSSPFTYQNTSGETELFTWPNGVSYGSVQVSVDGASWFFIRTTTSEGGSHMMLPGTFIRLFYSGANFTVTHMRIT